VGFLNTSYKFNLLVFEFTKTRGVSGSLQKTGDIPGTDFVAGHKSGIVSKTVGIRIADFNVICIQFCIGIRRGVLEKKLDLNFL
jgi:hypothetical protein